MVAVCVRLPGAGSVSGIALWNGTKLGWLREFVRLPHGVSSHDTFGRVLRLLDSGAFEQHFRHWVGQVVSALDQAVVARDGKTLRGSRDGENHAVHLVSAYAGSYGLTLGEGACRVRKGNAAMNLAILRRFVLNLLKLDATPKLSVRAKLKQAACDDDFRCRVLHIRSLS